jgi:hypothetical protein
VLWLLLALPFARSLLEARMTTHMLAQLPLLGVIGYCVGRYWLVLPLRAVGSRALMTVQSFNAGGLTGLILFGFVMVLWMLPRSLDLARLDWTIDVLKYVSVPAAGLAIAVSWHRLPSIARAVVHLEVIATLLRFGWGYLAAEQRLCLAYLAGDQQRAGELLLWLGALYALSVVWRPVFGTQPAPDKPQAGENRNLATR